MPTTVERVEVTVLGAMNDPRFHDRLGPRTALVRVLGPRPLTFVAGQLRVGTP